MADAMCQELPITFEHTDALAGLPPHHGDFFDRLRLAVAKVEGLTVVSSDAQFARYGVPPIEAGK